MTILQRDKCEMATMIGTPKHSMKTRIAHACLALAIICQLVTSQVMHPLSPVRDGDLFFEFHQYAGLAAFVSVLGFWLVTIRQKRATDLGLMLPWFSRARMMALWDDIKAHLTSLMQLRLPGYRADAALPSAVHGLGLLLMTAMAATGTIFTSRAAKIRMRLA